MRLLPLLLLGCSPLHVPQPPQTALLDGRGDGHLRIVYGAQGHQLDAAYAPADHLGIRGALQGEFVVYQRALATIGIGTFFHPGIARFGVWLDGGAGYGQGTYTVFNTTEDFHSPIGTASLTLEGGFETKFVKLGLTIRGNLLVAQEVRVFSVEPIVQSRFGRGRVGFTVYGGGSIPIISEDSADFNPVLIGAGVDIDIGRANP